MLQKNVDFSDGFITVIDLSRIHLIECHTYMRGFEILNCIPRPARTSAWTKLFVSSFARAGIMTYQRFKSMHLNIALLRNSDCQSALLDVFDLNSKKCLIFSIG